MTGQQKRPAVDWDAVEKKYRAGQLPVREIARQHGVSDVGIAKRARKHGWTRDPIERSVQENSDRLDHKDANLRKAGETGADTDAVEGLLISQIAGLHSGAMECMRRAVLPRQSTQGAARSWKDAINLSRAMIDTMAALERWRRHTAPSSSV